MRTYTREQVEQVVEAIKSEGNWLESFESGAREVLRRLDALPSPLTPETLPGFCGGCGVAGAVCSQCRKESQLSYWVGDGAESHVTPEALAAVDESRNPPAAPESSPTRSIAQGIADMTRHLPILPGVVPCDVKLAPRPRAATPTPEVPALAKLRPQEHAFIPGDATYGWERQCAHPGKDGLRHCGFPPEAHAQPEPAAPEVVWTGDGVRVLADGTVWDKYAPLRISRECAAIARALAEAKGEQVSPRELHEMRKAHEAVQSAHTAGVITSFGHPTAPVIVMPISHLEQDTATAKSQGAESMRERVKSLIMAEQAKQEDGPLSDDNGHAFRLLLRLADAVGALPLEEP